MASGQLEKIYSLKTTGFDNVIKDFKDIDTQSQKTQKSVSDLRKEMDLLKVATGGQSDEYKKAAQALEEARIKEQELLTAKKNLTNELKAAEVARQSEINQVKISVIEKDKEKASIKLTAEQIILEKLAIQQQNAELKNNVIANNASAGSITQLRAQLKLLTAQYIALSDEDRKSTLGKGLQTQVNGVNDQLKKLEGGIGNHQRKVGDYFTSIIDGFKHIATRVLEYVAVYTGIHAIEEFFKSSIDAALEADKASARFKGTLDNLGRVDLFEKFERQAKDLQERFKVFDHTEITGVFEKLITFGKLSEIQINSLTPVIIDFASKSGISLGEATDIILQAIEGQGRGLKKYGIDIKDAKTEAERFGIIMTELKGKVDGATDAFGESSQGKIKATEVKFKELKEELGNNFLPVWNKVLQVTNSFFEAINKLKGQSFGEVVSNTTARMNAFFTSGPGALTAMNKSIEEERQRQGIEDPNSKNVFVMPEDTVVGKKPLGGAGLSNVDNAAEKKAQNEAQRLREESLKRAEEYDKKSLEEKKKYDHDIGQADLEILKNQYENQEVGLNKRIQSLQAFHDKSLELIQKQKADSEAELSKEISIDLKKKGITPVEKTAILKYQTEKQKDIEATAAKETAKVQIDFSNSAEKIITDNFSKFDKASKEAYDNIKKHAEDAYNVQLAQIDIAKNDKLIQLDKDLQAGKIKNVEDYENQKAAIENAANIKLIQAELNRATQFEALLESLGMSSLFLKKKIKEDEFKIEEDFNKQILESNKKLAAEKEKLQREALSALQSFVDDGFDKQKNNIQDQINLNDKSTKAEIEQVNLSAQSEQEKAARIHNIQSQADANKTALEKKQKDADIKKAEFDKAIAIISIGIETAKAIAKITAAAAIVRAEYATVPIIGLALGAAAAGSLLAQIPIIIATAALQAAAIAVKPVAKFAGGGRVQQLQNGKVTAPSNIPVQPNGDNILATVKTGELILNEDQQRLLGGPSIFKALNIPGFDTGGLVGSSTLQPLASWGNWNDLQPPYNPASFLNPGSNPGNMDKVYDAINKQTENLSEVARQIHQRVDKIQVIVSAKQIEDTNDKTKKASSIGRL